MNGALPPLGATLGGCRLERLLGRGGMGAVYLGTAGALRRAVKVASFGGARGLELVERFEREGHALARLGPHPNVVRVHAAGREGALAWCVLDLVEGESLDRTIERGPLSVAEALRATEEVARALAHAHAHGVLHRDVKPANVIRRAEDGSAVLVDFGLALVEQEMAERLTVTGTIVGTTAWASPEQVDGKKDLDARTDVYGAGALLYGLLAGRAPFAGDSPSTLARKVLVEQPEPLATIRSDVPRDVLAIVARAMAKAPRDRHPDATSLADDLARVRAGARIPTGGLAGRVAVAGFAVALAVVGGIALALAPGRTRSEPLPAPSALAPKAPPPAPALDPEEARALDTIARVKGALDAGRLPSLEEVAAAREARSGGSRASAAFTAGLETRLAFATVVHAFVAKRDARTLERAAAAMRTSPGDARLLTGAIATLEANEVSALAPPLSKALDAIDASAPEALADEKLVSVLEALTATWEQQRKLHEAAVAFSYALRASPGARPPERLIEELRTAIGFGPREPGPSEQRVDLALDLARAGSSANLEGCLEVDYPILERLAKSNDWVARVVRAETLVAKDPSRNTSGPRRALELVEKLRGDVRVHANARAFLAEVEARARDALDDVAGASRAYEEAVRLEHPEPDSCLEALAYVRARVDLDEAVAVAETAVFVARSRCQRTEQGRLGEGRRPSFPHEPVYVSKVWSRQVHLVLLASAAGQWTRAALAAHEVLREAPPYAPLATFLIVAASGYPEPLLSILDRENAVFVRLLGVLLQDRRNGIGRRLVDAARPLER